MPQVRIDQLHIGQRVDLEGDRYADPDVFEADGDTSVTAHPEFQFQFETVLDTERETDDVIRVDFESGFSCGFPLDHLVDIDGEQIFADVNVYSRDLLDADLAVHYAKPWILEYPNGATRQYDTEDEACAKQRQYRANRGLDPMTGEPV